MYNKNLFHFPEGGGLEVSSTQFLDQLLTLLADHCEELSGGTIFSTLCKLAIKVVTQIIER